MFVLGVVAEIRGDARTNLEILGRLGLTVVEIVDGQTWELHFSEISSCDLIVDAIFGTGLKTPLQGMLETVVADINGSGIPVVAVDLPSGMSADTPDLIGDAIEAAVTVTLGAPKLPLVLPPAEMQAGDIIIADIGIPDEVFEAVEGPRIELLTRAQMRPFVQPRPLDSHKGDYGHVLVIAGAQGRSGAAHLTGMGALRSGAGLVTIATPAWCQAVLAAMAPEYMTEALGAADDGGIPLADLDRLLGSPARRDRDRSRDRHGAEHRPVRPRAGRARGRSAGARRRRAERVRARSRIGSPARKGATSSSRRTRASSRGWPA